MSDIAQGPGWWLASDGKWYPPRDESQAPAPGWWLASDGKWYPPMESEEPPHPDWWLASDGKWYPPDKKPGTRQQAAPRAPARSQGPAPRGAARPPVKPIPAPGGRAPAPAGDAPKGAGAPARGRPLPPAARGPQPPRTADDAAPAPATDAPAAPAAGGAKPPPPKPVVRPPQAGDHEGSRRSLTPIEHLRAREEQSKRDANVMADARRQAALRALGSLGIVAPDPEPEPQPEPDVDPEPALAGDAGSPGEATAAGAPASPPLREIVPAQLFAGTHQAARRLGLHRDHIDLVDQAGSVLLSLAGDDVVNVVIHKRLKGTSVTIERSSGEAVVVRGITPEDADEIRALLVEGRPPAGAEPADPTGTPAESGGIVLVDGGQEAGETATITVLPDAGDEPAVAVAGDADLVSKLVALHDAGVLTDEEFNEKVELVSRLTRGDDLAATAPGA